MTDDVIDSPVLDTSSDLPDSSDSVELPSDDLPDPPPLDLPDDSSSDNEIEQPEIPAELPSDEPLDAPSPELPEDSLLEPEPSPDISEISSQEKQDISSNSIEPELPVENNTSLEKDNPFQEIGKDQDMKLSQDDMQNSLTDDITEPSLPDESLSNRDSYGESGTNVREQNEPSVLDTTHSITDNDGHAGEPHLPEDEPLPVSDMRQDDVVTDTHDNAVGQPSMELPAQDGDHFGSGIDENALSASYEDGHEAISDQDATSSSLKSVTDDVNGTAVEPDDVASANSRVDALLQNQTEQSLSEMEMTEQISLKEEGNPEQQAPATGASETGPGALQSTLAPSSTSVSQSQSLDKSVDAEQEDINKFVQGLEKQGSTPEQYLEQKRAEYAPLDTGNSEPVDNHSVPNEKNSNSKAAKLVYKGTEPDLIDSTNEEKIREYRIGSPHEDFEAYKNILAAEKQHETGVSAQTGDSLFEALGTLKDAKGTDDSTYIKETDDYFYGKYGNAPYTDAYPASQDVTVPSGLGETPLEPSLDQPLVQKELKPGEIRQVLDKTVESANDNKNLDSNGTDAVLQKQIENTETNRAEFRETAAQYGMTPEQYREYLGKRNVDPEDTPELQPVRATNAPQPVDISEGNTPIKNAQAAADNLSPQAAPGSPPSPGDSSPPKPADTGRFVLQQFGDEKQIYLRMHDLQNGAPPDSIYYGEAGRVDLKVEQNDGGTKIRVQEAEVLSKYQEFDAAHKTMMLQKTIEIGRGIGATELYEEIGNNPAKLEYYKKQPGWVVEDNGSYARFSLSDVQQKVYSFSDRFDKEVEEFPYGIAVNEDGSVRKNASMEHLQNLSDLRDLAQKYPDGVKLDDDEYPDFSPYAYRHPETGNPVIVEIDMQGNHGSDYTAANQAAGLDKKPEGYTWHHHQDEKTMILVPTDLHGAVSHKGGVTATKHQNKS